MAPETVASKLQPTEIPVHPELEPSAHPDEYQINQPPCSLHNQPLPVHIQTNQAVHVHANQYGWPYPMHSQNTFVNQNPQPDCDHTGTANDEYDIDQLVDLAQKSSNNYRGIQQVAVPPPYPYAIGEKHYNYPTLTEAAPQKIRKTYQQPIRIDPYYKWVPANC